MINWRVRVAINRTELTSCHFSMSLHIYNVIFMYTANLEGSWQIARKSTFTLSLWPDSKKTLPTKRRQNFKNDDRIKLSQIKLGKAGRKLSANFFLWVIWSINFASISHPLFIMKLFSCSFYPLSWFYQADNKIKEKKHKIRKRADEMISTTVLITPNDRESVVSPDKIKIFPSLSHWRPDRC